MANKVRSDLVKYVCTWQVYQNNPGGKPTLYGQYTGVTVPFFAQIEYKTQLRINGGYPLEQSCNHYKHRNGNGAHTFKIRKGDPPFYMNQDGYLTGEIPISPTDCQSITYDSGLIAKTNDVVRILRSAIDSSVIQQKDIANQIRELTDILGSTQKRRLAAARGRLQAHLAAYAEYRFGTQPLLEFLGEITDIFATFERQYHNLVKLAFSSTRRKFTRSFSHEVVTNHTYGKSVFRIRRQIKVWAKIKGTAKLDEIGGNLYSYIDFVLGVFGFYNLFNLVYNWVPFSYLLNLVSNVGSLIEQHLNYDYLTPYVSLTGLGYSTRDTIRHTLRTFGGDNLVLVDGATLYQRFVDVPSNPVVLRFHLPTTFDPILTTGAGIFSGRK